MAPIHRGDIVPAERDSDSPVSLTSTSRLPNRSMAVSITKLAPSGSRISEVTKGTLGPSAPLRPHVAHVGTRRYLDGHAAGTDRLPLMRRGGSRS
jgi:hypothetical protein